MIFFISKNDIYFFTFLSCFPVIEIIWFNCVPFLGKGIRKITEGVNLTQKSHPVEVLVPGAEHIVHLMTKNWGDNDSIFQDVIETRGRGEKWDCVGYSLRQFTVSCGLIYMYIILESIECTRYKDHNFSFIGIQSISKLPKEIASQWSHVFLTGFAKVVPWMCMMLINICQ